MEILNQGQASVRKQSSRIKQNACFSYFLWNHFVLPFSGAKTPPPPSFLKSTSFILKLPFWFGSILKIYIKGPGSDHLVLKSLLPSVPWVWLSLKCLLSAVLHLNRPAPGIWGSAFSLCGWRGLTHSHLVKSHYSNENANERNAVGNGSRWVACQKCFTGEGVPERGGWAKLPRSPSGVFWGTCVGWHMAKSEGNTSSLMCLLLLVLIHGI